MKKILLATITLISQGWKTLVTFLSSLGIISTTCIFVVLCLISVFVTGCNIEVLDSGESVNDYIYPYLEFTPNEDGQGYTVTVVGGADLEEVYIPAEVEINGQAVAVTTFGGFENPEDASALKTLTLESVNTTLSAQAIESATNLESVKVELPSQTDARWGALTTPEKPGLEFDGWYIKGTDIKVKEGDKMISGFTTLEPKWKAHSLKHVDQVDATCTVNGMLAHYKCQSCQKYFADETALTELKAEDITIPASHTLEHVDAVAPTCTTAGNIEHYKCTVCSMLFSNEEATGFLNAADTILPAKGHLPILIASNDATCSETGTLAHYKCECCSLIFKDEACTQPTTEAELVVAELGHNWQFKTGTSGHWYECSRCHETKDSTSHVFENYTVTLEPTHDTAGTKTYTCSFEGCTETKTESIEPTGEHAWIVSNVVNPTCTQRGYTHYVCSHTGCTASYDGNYVDATGHGELEFHEKVDATCTKAGYKAYYQCPVCDGYFKDKEAKNAITAPEVIEAKGHTYGSTYYIEGDNHYKKCIVCNVSGPSSEHKFEKITEGRTPVTSQTCTTGAVYKLSCVCGKEGTETFTSGTGFGHSEAVVHEAVASNCTTQGHVEYYTCSKDCCADKFYKDKALTQEVKFADLQLALANHVCTDTFKTTEKAHIYICDACGAEARSESHTKAYEYDYYKHHWTCTVCRYESEEENHTLTGTVGSRICIHCSYCETESQDSGSSFSVQTVNKEPDGELTAVQNGTTWTFTLTSTNENAVPDTYIWHLDGEPVEWENTNVFVFEAPEARTYRVMCVFMSNGRYGSKSMTITGGGLR